jgi:hypothetical protein
LDEEPAVAQLRGDATLSSEAKDALASAERIREIPALMASLSQTAQDSAFLATVNDRIAKSPWDSVVRDELWQWVKPRLPKLVYFGEYQLLPSKVNLQRVGVTGVSGRLEP